MSALRHDLADSLGKGILGSIAVAEPLPHGVLDGAREVLAGGPPRGPARGLVLDPKAPRQLDRAPVVRRGGPGWAVAAAILLAWVSQSFAPRGAESPAPRENIAGFAGFASSDAAVDAYLEKAREEGVILGEAPPPTLVGSRELTDGSGFEVIVVRQVYERRVMPELYRVVSVDDLGGTEKVVIRPRTEALR